MELLKTNTATLPPATGGGPGPENGLAQERIQATSRFLAAGRAAVSQALSSDSDAFMKQVRQKGGE